MSITFRPEMAPITGYRVIDVTGGRSATIHDTYEAATAELVALRGSGEMLPGCTDPEWVQMSGMHIDVLTADNGEDEDVAVNVSNANSVGILTALGLLTDEDHFSDVCSGGMDATDFMGRVLTALAIAPADAGMPSYEIVGSGATMVRGARREGYLQSRLSQLHALAQWCINNNRAVGWG